MKPLFTSIVLAACSFAQPSAQMVLGTPGITVGSAGSCINLGTNATPGAGRCAISFSSYTARTLSEVQLVNNAVGGTLAPGEIVMEIYNTNLSTGKPGTLLYSSTTTSPSSISGAPGSTFTWSAFTPTPTIAAFTLYWAIVKNVNTVPTTNYPTFRMGASTSNYPFLLTGSPGAQPGTILQSDNAGASWVYSNAIPFFRVKYTDNSIYGWPYTNVYTESNAARGAYSTNEAGTEVVTPAYAIKVRGVCMNSARVNAPTNPLKYGLYTGSSGNLTLLGTTSDIPSLALPVGAISASTCGFLANSVIVPASSILKVVMRTTGSDTSSTAYRPAVFTFPSDASNKSMLPFNGSIRSTFCAASCTLAASWSFDAGQYAPFVLILEPGDEISGGNTGEGSSFSFIQ
jgi:hypothetical protein